MSELKLLYSNEQIKVITDELKKGYPVIMPVQKYSKTKYIRLVETVKENDENMLCRHFLDKILCRPLKNIRIKIGNLVGKL